jgi:hypothetical protein
LDTSVPDDLTIKTESTIFNWGLVIFSPCAKLVNYYYNMVLTHLVNFNEGILFYGNI